MAAKAFRDGTTNSRGGGKGTSGKSCAPIRTYPKCAFDMARISGRVTRVSCSPQSFKLHLGADLDIVTKDAAWYPQPEQQHPVPDTQQNTDPFAGLPFRGLAEKLGEHFEPVAKAIQEEHKDGRNAARKQFVAEAAGPDDIRVPSVLPITKWYRMVGGVWR